MSSAAAVGADIVAVGAADEVYCSAAGLARLRHDYGLSERGEVNLHVRVPPFDALPLTGRGPCRPGWSRPTSPCRRTSGHVEPGGT